MASENRTFTLIGKFEDGISPSLKKINKDLVELTKTFNNLGTSLKPVSKGMKDLSLSTKSVSEAFGKQRGSVESSIRAMNEYARQAGKVVAANKAIEKSAKEAGSMQGVPAGGAGGRSSAAAVGGLVAGQQIAGMISGAIIRGFQVGVSLMQKPFQYAINAFGERMQDELSDIQSAGAMFAIDKRDKMGVFKGFEDARDFQKQLNVRLAQSAAALPGATEDYVKQAKQLTDNMMLAYSQNKKSFTEFAKTLGPVSGERDALGIVLQKFTEKSVLLGMGSGGSSMYGVPQILAMLLDQERVNVKSFRQFAAYQSNPLLKNALERAEPELAKTVKGSTERLKLIQKVLDEAVPNEVVMALKNSLSGVKEAIRSGLLDPEAGLFGLGRALNLSVPKLNALGQYLNKNGQVVDSLSKAATESASLFDLLRDSLGGFVLPLSELVNVLPQIFDPLLAIGKNLVNFRNVAQNFYRNFNQYVADFELLSKNIGGAAGGKIKATAGARGALTAFSDLLVAVGAFKEADFTRIVTQLKKPDVQLGSIAKEIFTKLMNSDFMRQVGEVVGSVIGSTLKMVGDIMAGVTDMTQAGPFAKGLKQGWDKAQGSIGVSEIFRSLFSIITKALVSLFQSAPLETTILAGMTLGLPLLQGAIAAGITGLFESMATLGGAGVLGAVFSPAGLFALIAALVVFQGPIIAFSNSLIHWGEELQKSTDGLTAGVGLVVSGAGKLLKGLTNFFSGLWDIISGFFTGDTQKVKNGIKRIFSGIADILKGIVDGMAGSGQIVLTAIDNFFNVFADIINQAKDKVLNSVGINKSPDLSPDVLKGFAALGLGPIAAPLMLSDFLPPSSTPGPKRGRSQYNGGLGDAISEEMRNKPSGADLVIANSSETIIPAAGGLGMKDFMDTLRSGFGNITDLFRKSDDKINLNQTENNRHFTAIDSKLQKLTSGAGLLGMGGPGNIIGVGKALLGMGLQVGMNPYFQYGRGFLPGGGGYIGRHAPGSYHYLGRALDVSGPPALLDAAYNRLRFTHPAELLWRVPGHFDHLHVAYALGAGNPAFFSSQRDAMDWERKATLGNVRVSSITSNSSEGFGGDVNVNAPITIHQQPGQSSEQLASLVAMELTNAIRQARSSSMYV